MISNGNGARRKARQPENGRVMEEYNNSRSEVADMADEFMQDETMQKAMNAGREGVRKARDIGNSVKNEFMSDYATEMSDDMRLTSKFGFKMFVYALLIWGAYMVGSLQSMLLVAGWVLLVEKNLNFVKIAISACALYIFIAVGFDLVYEVVKTIRDLVELMPGRTAPEELITDILSTLMSWILRIDGLAQPVIGLWGLIKAKGGNYFRFSFVENLFN